MLTAISPIDGRYSSKASPLQEYFSELALIKARVRVEIEYFRFLASHSIGPVSPLSREKDQLLEAIWKNFSLEDASYIKEIESRINHDVKSVEYFVKESLSKAGLGDQIEMVHFGLTSQDINNTATPLLITEALDKVLNPEMDRLIQKLTDLAQDWRGVPMLARTHGQPASPTTVGKELEVFVERLANQLAAIKRVQILAKFGGATGNLNAHKVAFPDLDWPTLANEFVSRHLGLVRSQKTTQIAHYDDLAELFHGFERVNTILIDLCRDIWTYISMDYFKQTVNPDEVGSSAMPHKVNPIDFENAEGNLGIANAMFAHLAAKLPISRLQRDLTDSTVLRNVGVPFAHTLIAMTAVQKGLGKLAINPEKLSDDLEANWAVVAEAIQTILRREGYEKPYEALKALTRGKQTIRKEDIHVFVRSLNVREEIKSELLNISPHNYVGYF